MDNSVYIKHICNCGLLIKYKETCILVDAPCEPYDVFCPMDKESEIRFLEGMDEFSNINGIIFTHLHPDHYDVRMVSSYKRMKPSCFLFCPNEDTDLDGCFTIGDIEVIYHRMPHIPMDYEIVPTYVFAVKCGDFCIYICGDANMDKESHLAFVSDKKFDAVFWNPLYLGHPHMRELMVELDAKYNFYYHIPAFKNDKSGIRKSSMRRFEMHKDEFNNAQILSEYPNELMLNK